MSSNTLDLFRTIICDRLDVPIEAVTPEASLKDLGADSLDLADLVLHIEKRFKVSIPEKDYRRLRTVGSAVKYLSERGAIG